MYANLNNLIRELAVNGDGSHLVTDLRPNGYHITLRGGSPEQGWPLFDASGEGCLIGVGETVEAAMADLDNRCAPLPERYAFWTYDQFPYMLGGKVKGVADPDGYVRTHNYGAYKFKPFAIVQGQAGASLLSNIDTIREEYRAASTKLGREFLNRWRAELARKGVTHPSEPEWAKKDLT